MGPDVCIGEVCAISNCEEEGPFVAVAAATAAAVEGVW